MNIELKPIAYADKLILRNLMELYRHDYSEYDGADVNEHGRFEYRYIDNYWTEEGRAPYFVTVDDKLAGFALTREWVADDGGQIRSLAEYFVMRKYRRKGVGSEAARALFAMLPGRWQVGQEWCNKPARAFWLRVIDDCTGGKYERNETENGPELVFETPGETKPSG